MPESDTTASQAYKGKCKRYIVWSPDGPTEPKRVHPTHGAALHEAHRMARQFPGQKFYVMAQASRCCSVDPEAAHV